LKRLRWRRVQHVRPNPLQCVPWEFRQKFRMLYALRWWWRFLEWMKQ
jgi:glycerophosphoryl diester phosphodiesterase